MKAPDVWTVRYEWVGVLMIFVFPFVSRGVHRRKRGIRGREKTCVAVARRIVRGLCWYIYTPVITVS